MKINECVYALICFEKHSGEELSKNQYYFLLNTNSCHACNEVIVKFLNQYKSKKPIKLILKGNTKREIGFHLPLNEHSNLIVYYDLTNTKINFKMPILINPKAQELKINEINISNYKRILSNIK